LDCRYPVQAVHLAWCLCSNCFLMRFLPSFQIEWTVLALYMKKCASWILFGENISRQNMSRMMKQIIFIHLLVLEKCLYKQKGIMLAFMKLIFFYCV
jgi:hypothetical protein